MSAIVFIAVAAVAGWLAVRVLPGAPPYAALACALAGLIASVLIGLPLGDLGPHLLEVALLPAAGGALLGALACRLVLQRMAAPSPS